MRQPAIARFLNHVDFNSAAPCWLWTATKLKAGYGQFMYRGRPVLAHRFVWEFTYEKIPAELTVDHLCRQPSCVNPSHMEIVTLAENIRRGTQGKKKREQTHCIYGHELIGKNLYIKKNGNRRCYECSRAQYRAYYKRNHEKELGRSRIRYWVSEAMRG